MPTGNWWAVLGAVVGVANSVVSFVSILWLIKYLKRDKEAVG